MANRYQNQPYPADDAYGQNAPRAKGEGDPLAELARLIGQTDPFAGTHSEPPRRPEPAPTYHDEHDDEVEAAPPGPPPWMQRAAAHEAQQHQGYEDVHPVQRYAAPHDEVEPDYHQAPAFAAHTDYQTDYHADAAHEQQQPLDPARYDDALYGHADDAHVQYAQDEQYADDPYAYQDGYAQQEEAPKRRSGLMTVAAILALAVVGTGGAFAYRTFLGSSRSGEPPVIKAEPGPNKIVPPSATASADASGKATDRIGGTAPERMVSREEQPVNVQDATKAGGPRVVFPPLNQNANPPTTASVSPTNKPMVGNGAMQGGDEPRKIRTFAVRGDQVDGATPAARQAPARLTGPAPAATAPAAPRAANANASANAPLSLSPQVAPPAAAPARTAALNTAPQDIAPSSSAATGGYLVQLSSQRNEADARTSFKALQGKYPSVLGSRSPVIRRMDLGEKGIYYRALVGPFTSSDEAMAFRKNLEAAGGPQGIVQRN